MLPEWLSSPCLYWEGSGVVANQVPAAFAVVKVDVDGAPGLAVTGEVDVSVGPELTRAVEAAIRDSVGVFVLDLCDVEFLDSSGLGVILRARAMLARDERALAIVCPPGGVRRLFAVAGVAELLVLYDSREDLTADLVRAR
jgi:anti-sigma B factor antagonist